MGFNSGGQVRRRINFAGSTRRFNGLLDASLPLLRRNRRKVSMRFLKYPFTIDGACETFIVR